MSTEAAISKKKSLSEQLSGFVAMGFGIALGRYAGIMLLIPFVGSAISWFFLSRFRPSLDKSLLAASAAQIGQICWFVFALALGTTSSAVITELCIYVPLVALLLIKQSKFWIIVGMIYQLVSSAINIFSLSQATFGSTESRALVAHIGIRLYALIFMSIALWQVWKIDGKSKQEITP